MEVTPPCDLNRFCRIGMRWRVAGFGFRMTVITIEVHSRSGGACCPQCGQSSERVHSRYWRTLADLPWQGRQVEIRWLSRKFFCESAACPRRIFTERLPQVAASYAWRTPRLDTALTCLGFACGGSAGSRLTDRLGMVASPATILRLIRKSAVISRPVPRVLGVDDWSYRRGHRYGTILCDLERGQVVDLLPERSAESFQTWLEQHRQVEVISRDRGDPYIKGATAGAPQAVQVADRFHLIHNLLDALCRLLDRHAAPIQATVRTLSEQKAREVAMTNSPLPTAWKQKR